MSNRLLLSCRGWHEDEGAGLEGAENQALRLHRESLSFTAGHRCHLLFSPSLCVIAEGSEQLKSVLAISKRIVCPLCLPL